MSERITQTILNRCQTEYKLCHCGISPGESLATKRNGD